MFFPVAVIALFASSVLAATPTILSIAFNGSGCPAGSTYVSYSNDRSSATVVFSEFVPYTSSDPTTSYQNCQAVASVLAPAGQQFSLNKVKYEGFADLDKNVVALHESTYYFQANLPQKSATGTKSGPRAGELDLSNSFTGSPIYSACGGTSIISVNVAVSLNSTGSAEGYISVDDAVIGPFVTQACY